MELRQIFLLLSQKGIDKVNLEMLPKDERIEIYEKYAELFVDEPGKAATYIVVKAYCKTNNISKIRERLINEVNLSTKDKRFKYCYYCSLLLNNNDMALFYHQFIDDSIDKNVDYKDFYDSLKSNIDSMHNGIN